MILRSQAGDLFHSQIHVNFFVVVIVVVVPPVLNLSLHRPAQDRTYRQHTGTPRAIVRLLQVRLQAQVLVAIRANKFHAQAMISLRYVSRS